MIIWWSCASHCILYCFPYRYCCTTLYLLLMINWYRVSCFSITCVLWIMRRRIKPCCPMIFPSILNHFCFIIFIRAKFKKFFFCRWTRFSFSSFFRYSIFDQIIIQIEIRIWLWIIFRIYRFCIQCCYYSCLLSSAYATNLWSYSLRIIISYLFLNCFIFVTSIISTLC